MQYLKDEVKNRIAEAALQEFADRGYLDASMRRIAAKAGVSIGNLYRYFTNKEQLFEELLGPVYNLFLANIPDEAEIAEVCRIYTMNVLEHVADEFIGVLHEYGVHLLILVDKSQGTKYANTRFLLVDKIEQDLLRCLLPELKDKGIEIKDNFIFHLMASTFFEGMISIIKNYRDEEKIRYLMRQLIFIYFCDIDRRFK